MTALLAPALWGGLYVAARVLVQYLDPIFVVLIRLVVTVPFYGLLEYLDHGSTYPRSTKLDGRGLIHLMTVGAVGFGGSATLMFEGTHLTSAHLGALVTAVGPLFVLLFSRLFLGTPISMAVLPLIGISVAGVLWADRIWTIGSAVESGWGVLALAGAAICWGIYSALSQRLLRSYPPWSVMKYGAMGGLVVSAAVWIATGSHVTTGGARLGLGSTALLLTYVSIVATGLAYYSWTYSVKTLGPEIPSLFYFLQPVVATFLAVGLLHERISSDFIAGASLVIAAAVTGWWLQGRLLRAEGLHNGLTAPREGTDL